MSVPTITLEISQVAAEYGVRQVLADISLSLHTGEVLVISGANGSGKSTLLRLLAGLQRPSAGTIHYTFDSQQLPPANAVHLIGWLAPDLQLYRELTGLENLAFFAAVRGLRPDPGSLEALLTDLGLAGRGADLLSAYSSGMAQRLRYAYALLHRPPILLLDEPTVTLDERGAAVVERVVQQQRSRGITVIATNDPRELRFADQLLRLG
jgi:heme exporter protein A